MMGLFTEGHGTRVHFMHTCGVNESISVRLWTLFQTPFNRGKRLDVVCPAKFSAEGTPVWVPHAPLPAKEMTTVFAAFFSTIKFGP